MDEAAALGHVSKAFVRLGLLLESDARFPSVVGLATGRRLKGPWWCLRQSHAIFRVLKKFASRKDNLGAKLVSGKVTFVQRKFWPELFVVAVAREGWQTEGLSKTAASLLALVEERGEIDTTAAKSIMRTPVKNAARELERKLLVQSEEFHTEHGFHAKRLRSWARWSGSAGLEKDLPALGDAKSRLENRETNINREYRADGSLPWQRRR
jgi:hypothetical protein